MLDPVKVERAEAEIDKFISSRSKQREEANALEAMWRATELRVIAKRREENRIAWCEYYRRVAGSHLKSARAARSRARALERGQTT